MSVYYNYIFTKNNINKFELLSKLEFSLVEEIEASLIKSDDTLLQVKFIFPYNPNYE